MYEAPQLKRYGTLRELTLGGGSLYSDPFGPTSDGNAGCLLTPGCVNS